jgi:antitoxin HigA-1
VIKELRATMTTLRHPSLEPSHPGALVAEVLGTLQITTAEAARQLGVSQDKLLDVIGERCTIDAQLAAKLQEVLGTNADGLIRMQAGHDLWRARQ